MEDAVSGLGFEVVVIARPSLLTGDRKSLEQPARPGETLAQHAFKWLSPLLPRNYRAISASEVASALVNHVKSAGAGRHILLSGELQIP